MLSNRPQRGGFREGEEQVADEPCDEVRILVGQEVTGPILEDGRGVVAEPVGPACELRRDVRVVHRASNRDAERTNLVEPGAAKTSW